MPMRTCIACRETGDKRSLLRLVRTEEGVFVDASGKRAGRGAYLHTRKGCWSRALAHHQIVERALRTTITDADRERLNEFAASLPDSEDGE